MSFFFKTIVVEDCSVQRPVLIEETKLTVLTILE